MTSRVLREGEVGDLGDILGIEVDRHALAEAICVLGLRR